MLIYRCKLEKPSSIKGELETDFVLLSIFQKTNKENKLNFKKSILLYGVSFIDFIDKIDLRTIKSIKSILPTPNKNHRLLYTELREEGGELIG